MRVPSSIVSQEYNYLINPDHPDVAGIKIISIDGLLIDQRLHHGLA